MKKILFFLLGIGITLYLVSLIYVGIHTQDDTAKPSDAILVLGAKTLYKNKTNPCLKARVEKAVSLYKKKFAPVIIMTGGNDGYEKNNQAELMHSLAVTRDVPSDAILLEKQSSNTYENFIYTKKILRKNNLTSVIIVSDPYHLARAELLAKTVSIPATVSPAVDSPCWSRYTFLGFDYFRDALALVQYIATGKIAISSLTRD